MKVPGFRLVIVVVAGFLRVTLRLLRGMAFFPFGLLGFTNKISLVLLIA